VFIINLKAARALESAILPGIVTIADDVIEQSAAHADFLSRWFRLCRRRICAGIGDLDAGLFNRNVNRGRSDRGRSRVGLHGLRATAFPRTSETGGHVEAFARRTQGTGGRGDCPLLTRGVLPQWREL
jgi:hypothetical protein